MPTLGLFIQKPTSQPIVHFVVTSVPVQPTIPNPLVSSVQVTHLVQLTASSPVSLSSLIPLVSEKVVPLPRGKNPNVSMMSRTTNVSGSQAHMVGMNWPSSGAIPNLAGPLGSNNVQYQQPNPVGLSGSSNIQYWQPYVARVQYQPPYFPYG